jgi:hypothetical protein
MPSALACAITLPIGGTPKVLVGTTVMQGVLDYLQEQNVEMGGLLLGAAYDGLWGSDDIVIAVTDYARSTEFDSTQVSLRMDPDVWERARLRCQETSVVVGWEKFSRVRTGGGVSFEVSIPGIGIFRRFTGIAEDG